MRLHGPALKALRKAQGLSLRGLQAATGIDRRYLSQLENATTDDVEAERAAALAGALGVPTEAIADEGDTVTAEAIEAPVIDLDDELTRYTPEQVAEFKWLPWTARKIRELVYARKIYAHRDGGRITLTREDVRRTSALGAIEPFEGPAA